MNHGVIIKSSTRAIVTEDVQKDINMRIPNIDFEQVNNDLALYGISIISISSLKHCQKMKTILSDNLIPPTCCIILKENRLIDMPSMNGIISNNYEITMSKTNVPFDRINKLLIKVIGCNKDISGKIYNAAIFNGESSLGDFPLEVAELKMEQLNKINERKKQPLVEFKLRKIN